MHSEQTGLMNEERKRKFKKFVELETSEESCC